MGRMNEYKEMDSMKYLAAFLLTVIVFAIGVAIGNYFNAQKVERVKAIENDIRLDTLGAEIQQEILTEEPCKFVNSTPLTEDLYELSRKLNHVENIYGQDDESVLRLKERYSLLELRHWLYIKRIKQECGKDLVPILYFYNNDKNCDKCEDQGYVLTYIRRKYDNVRVYSYDIRIDNTALETVKEIYDVNSAPTVIIDGTKHGFMTRDDVERAIRNATR